MNLCDYKHEAIAYSSNGCPACDLLDRIDDTVNELEDKITDLEHEVDDYKDRWQALAAEFAPEELL